MTSEDRDRQSKFWRIMLLRFGIKEYSVFGKKSLGFRAIAVAWR